MDRTLRILLIAASPDERARVAQALKHDFHGVEIAQVSNSAGLEHTLSNSGYDLVITDSAPGWADGLNVSGARSRRASRSVR